MFNKISPIILGILLFLVLVGSDRNIWAFLASLLILILVALYVNYRRFGVNWSHLLLPLFFLMGIGMVGAIMPSTATKIVFTASAVISFVSLELHLGRESHLLQNLYLLSVFMIYLGLFAARFYFVDVSFWWILAILGIFTYFLILQGFAGVSLPSKKYFCLIITLAVTEAALGLMLWPTHYLVNAVVLFLFFYLLWLFAFSAFFGKLSAKKIAWQLTLVGIALIVTFSTTAWQPVVR